jgi:hyperpolarization activated cyclic nucleotide-gated potassium channel 2
MLVFRKWFWIDLISTIPFDIFINAVSDLMSGNAAKSTSFLRYFRLTKLLQLLRLLRITRFLRSKTQFEDMINIPYDDALVLIRMFSAFLGIICYAHISACMQFMIPMIMNFPHNSWVMIRGLQNERLSIQYG